MDFWREDACAQREAMDVLRRSTSGAGAGGCGGAKRGANCEKKGDKVALAFPLSKGGRQEITSSNQELREAKLESSAEVSNSTLPCSVETSSSKVKIKPSVWIAMMRF